MNIWPSKLSRKQKTISYSFRQGSRAASQLLGGAKNVKRDEGSIVTNDTRTFAYFLVLGIPHDTPAEELKTGMAPKLLYTYPEDAELPVADLASFCYPECNMPLSRVGGCESLSQLYQTVFKQARAVEDYATPVAFLFTVGVSDQSLLYGVCVRYEEIVGVPPSFLKLPYPEMEAKLKECSTYYIAPRCFCILSEFPFFRPHLSVLYSIVATERYNADVLLHKVMAFQRERLLEEHGEEALSMLATPQLSPSMDYITGQMIVEQYHTLAVPPPEKVAKCVLQMKPRLVSFTFQTGSERELLADWCLPQLCRIFSFKDIVVFFTALLLEKSVLVISDNLNEASAIVMAAIPMLHPIVWQGPMIPVLPKNMCAYLDAPVPTIIGLGTSFISAAKRQEVADHTLIMDCNTRTVQAPPKMKRVPNKSKLDDLRKLHQHLNKADVSTTEQARLVRQFLLVIRVYHNAMEEVVINSLIQAGLSVADKPTELERAADCSPSGWSDFLRELYQTQHYVMYVYGIQQGISDKHNSMQEKWEQVVAKLTAAEEELMQLEEIIRVHTEKRNQVRDRVHALQKVKAALNTELGGQKKFTAGAEAPQ